MLAPVIVTVVTLYAYEHVMRDVVKEWETELGSIRVSGASALSRR